MKGEKGGASEPLVEVTLLNTADAADYLRVTPQTVTRYVQEGYLDPFHTPGGHRRFALAALNAMIGVSEEKQSERLRLLTAAEVYKRVRVSHFTLDRMVEAGLVALRLPGKTQHRRFDSGLLMEYLEKTRKPRST